MRQACVERRLDTVDLTIVEGYAVSVILASKGYPGSYPKGVPISFGQIPEGKYSFLCFYLSKLIW